MFVRSCSEGFVLLGALEDQGWETLFYSTGILLCSTLFYSILLYSFLLLYSTLFYSTLLYSTTDEGRFIGSASDPAGLWRRGSIRPHSSDACDDDGCCWQAEEEENHARFILFLPSSVVPVKKEFPERRTKLSLPLPVPATSCPCRLARRQSPHSDPASLFLSWPHSAGRGLRGGGMQ